MHSTHTHTHLLSLSDRYEFCSHSLTRFFPRTQLTATTYAEFLCQCNFSESVARSLFRHLVKAVCCLHSKGLYHCDIKLDNILVKRSRHGELVLALGDFGRLSTTSVVFHSNPPVYAPPEASAQGVLFDAGPADVYSCGTCLLQLVALTYVCVCVCTLEMCTNTDENSHLLSQTHNTGIGVYTHQTAEKD